jgi:hypothetical protein
MKALSFYSVLYSGWRAVMTRVERPEAFGGTPKAAPETGALPIESSFFMALLYHGFLAKIGGAENKSDSSGHEWTAVDTRGHEGT